MPREKIKLVSTGKMPSGEVTGTFRTTTKNKKLHPDKMELKCYDKRIRQHVTFKETKI